MIRVRHLFVSPGHNYVGHHGGPPGQHPVIEADQIECVAGRGIRGDRYFDHQENHKGQITFFSQDIIDAMRRELNLPEARPAATRRNVFISGADLNALVGKEFEIQGVRFAGVEECRPCYWMNHAFGAERAEAWLKGRGGLRARVLTDGVLRGIRERVMMPSLANFKRFDVRELVRGGIEPFPEIRRRVDALKAGEGIIIVAPFLPSPLVEKLGSEGFASKVERGTRADWIVYFWREAD